MAFSAWAHRYPFSRKRFPPPVCGFEVVETSHLLQHPFSSCTTCPLHPCSPHFLSPEQCGAWRELTGTSAPSSGPKPGTQLCHICFTCTVPPPPLQAPGRIGSHSTSVCPWLMAAGQTPTAGGADTAPGNFAKWFPCSSRINVSLVVLNFQRSFVFHLGMSIFCSWSNSLMKYVQDKSFLFCAFWAGKWRPDKIIFLFLYTKTLSLNFKFHFICWYWWTL